MKKLKDLDSYEQSVQKLEFCLFHIENLKKKEVLDMNDQIMINLLLNVFKSSMEYSIQYLRRTNNVSKKQLSYIPNKNDFKKVEKFYELLKQRFGVDDKKGRDIFDNLFKTKIYNQFNKMQNNEKHAQINEHEDYIIENTGNLFLPGKINIGNNIITRRNDGESKGVVIDGKEIDLSRNEGYSYDEAIYFEYNKREVFEFLYEVYELVNNFVVDIKEYVDSKE
ncbi:hypothetical protein [Mammaliicoccus sciuri]|uniref:hypothetical protein n=1 Tax=Mammaliicoccus sciuri TaxID=1296 RepID=UPI001FB20548|nr:hypothetical protein [Mammaliicoccus sciuri]MCJ0951040.1 hypothetical protein [Mammaliicoccus sciuri]